ncbi:hypothetical protein SCUCBS95973_008834 [Sporothrix curviconia]|uniref:Uncharacterized protein n=1 Tax=Sporothrix curviconia TaxID=1260050 RepID=A0ABP0CT56_9PEZI
MDEPHSVFWLSPGNKEARDIVYHTHNHTRLRVHPYCPGARALRIGTDDNIKVPSRLVTFGCLSATCDVFLPGIEPTADHCYFDLHPITDEILFHDVSPDGNTSMHCTLFPKPGILPQPLQCVVEHGETNLLQEEINKLGFESINRFIDAEIDAEIAKQAKVPSSTTSVARAGAWANKKDESPSGRLAASETTGFDIFRPRRQESDPEAEPKQRHIVWAKRGFLGGGGQGQVHRVVDLCTGDHYAR